MADTLADLRTQLTTVETQITALIPAQDVKESSAGGGGFEVRTPWEQINVLLKIRKSLRRRIAEMSGTGVALPQLMGSDTDKPTTDNG